MRTKTELQKAESNLGCRYSALLKLQYFDAPRMLILCTTFFGLSKALFEVNIA